VALLSVAGCSRAEVDVEGAHASGVRYLQDSYPDRVDAGTVVLEGGRIARSDSMRLWAASDLSIHQGTPLAAPAIKLIVRDGRSNARTPAVIEPLSRGAADRGGMDPCRLFKAGTKHS
jgi:hypothetical protein